MSAAVQDDFLVLGAGVFGASTALHLIRTFPHASIRLVDRTPFPCQVGASWDLNKVIRADYTDLLYMEKALEAKKAWKEDPLFRPFYHESGVFWISRTDLTGRISSNYRTLQADDDFEIVSTDEARKLYGGMLAGADYTGVSQVLINQSGGWAEAKQALQHVIEAAIGLGVKYTSLKVETLLFDGADSCVGIRSAEDSFYAKNVVLCAGAGTAKLLADSAPCRPDIQVGDRLIAAAICTAIVELSEEQASRLRGGPVCVQDSLPGRGGSIPPNGKRELKFWRDVSFKNTIIHPSGLHLSVPPEKPDLGQWDISTVLSDEIGDVNQGIFGSAGNDYQLTKHRICWDAITPTKDFIISPHPRVQNLVIATGGSFHGWKFLPILGRYVIEAMQGKLDPKLAKAWAWDREEKTFTTGNELWPKRELADLSLDLI